jgi:hypothetical protein
MKLQLEDVVDYLKVAFPVFDLFFLFDHSSGHTKKCDDGLSSQSMNLEFGGKVPEKRRSELFDRCILLNEHYYLLFIVNHTRSFSYIISTSCALNTLHIITTWHS